MLPDLQAVSSWHASPLSVASCQRLRLVRASDVETRCRLKFWLDIEQMARYECSLLEFSVPWGFFCDAGLS
jgi:hypothetical protein